MSDSSDIRLGLFAIPAKHMDELHRLLADADKAAEQYRPDMWYRKNLLFERAMAVARPSALFEGREYEIAKTHLWIWFRQRFSRWNEDRVLNPDELAPIARELASIRTKDVIREVLDKEQAYRAVDVPLLAPLIIELFDALVRVVTPAPAEHLGLVIAWFRERYRQPPEMPETPTPMDEPLNLMGWFAVPDRYLDELRSLAAKATKAWERRRGFSREYNKLECRLFERAREVAAASAIFDHDPAIYRGATDWYRDFDSAPDLDEVLDPDEHEAAAKLLRNVRIEDVTRWVHEWIDLYAGAEPARVIERIQQLIHVLTARPSERLGFVKGRFYEEIDKPKIDEAARAEITDTFMAIRGKMDEAEARLARVAARQREARAAQPGAGRTRAAATRIGRAARTGHEPALPAAAIVAGEEELARRFPWLGTLSKGKDIMTRFARRMAWARMAGQDQAARDILPERIPIALHELLADDFDDAPLAVERAGRQAMRDAIRRAAAEGAVMLDMRGGEPDVGVYLGGARLRLRHGRLHIDAFLGNAAGPLLGVQRAWCTALLAEAEETFRVMHAANPWLLGAFVERELEEEDDEALLDAVDQEMGWDWDPSARTDEAKHDELRARRALRRFVRLCREDWPGYEDQGSALIGLIAPDKDKAAGLRRADTAARKLVQGGELLAGLARKHKVWARAEEALDDKHVVRLAGPFHALRHLGALVAGHAGKAPHGVHLPGQAAELARTLDALEAAHGGRAGLVKAIWDEERYWSREVVGSAYDELRAVLGRAVERGQGFVWLEDEGDSEPDARRLRMTGYFLVPETHLGELHGLEAEADAARRSITRRRGKAVNDDKTHAAEIRGRACKAMLCARAAELAAASSVLDIGDLSHWLKLQGWLAERYLGGEPRAVLDPDELAAMARRVRRTSVATVLRQGHVSADDAPHVRTLFEALVRFLGEAPLIPSMGRHGLVLVTPPPLPWSFSRRRGGDCGR